MEYMNGSGGTDLAAAYGSPDTMTSTASAFQTATAGEQQVRPSMEYSPEISNDKPVNYSRSTSMNQARQEPEGPMYNQSELLQDINQKALKDQMELLKQEINQQKVANKLQYKESYEKNSIYDKYSKRTKDVFRFLSLSMIIIFALAMHDIVAPSLKDYIESIDVTQNRALGMRLAYPFAILILYWSLKAYKF